MSTDVAAPATVWGVPLQAGERVLYYHRDTSKGERIFLFALGLFLMPVLIGFLLLYWAIFYEKTHDRALVITDRRFVSISGERALRTEIPLGKVERIVRVTGKKNQYVVHGPGMDLLIFNIGEHPLRVLEPVIKGLAEPSSLPVATFEA